MLKHLALASLVAFSALHAKEPAATAENSAVVPADRNNEDWWKNRHAAKAKLAAEKQYELIFIGDSITHGFEGAGKAMWAKYYEPRKALNLGFSGDRTEHVLWRLDHEELKNQEDAKLVIMMIGTNNTGHKKQDPAETAAGVKAILGKLETLTPKAKVLLLGIFPRSAKANDEMRLINTAINGKIAEFADGERVHFLDISDQFLTKDGTLTKEVMPDLLHPKEKGYQIWAEAIEPKIKELGL
ncbi:MAG: GDSL-type esterase/lipase family protein [Verrucomicrobiales bacterium]